MLPVYVADGVLCVCTQLIGQEAMFSTQLNCTKTSHAFYELGNIEYSYGYVAHMDGASTTGTI
jgi:hypothetical protein